MSLLDINESCDIGLSPQILKDLYGIESHQSQFKERPIYSKGYIYGSYIEVWYPNTTYYGSLWVHAYTPLTKNMVHVSFMREPTLNWMQREDVVYEDLTLDDLVGLIRAIQHKHWDYLDLLASVKPFTQKKTEGILAPGELPLYYRSK